MAEVTANGTSPKRRSMPSRLSKLLLISIVVLYAAGLLLAPLVAIVWGALSEGGAAFVREINTLFGLCIAWVLVRDNFWGRRILNGLVDMPFAVSPVIAGFMLILLFGRG